MCLLTSKMMQACKSRKLPIFGAIFQQIFSHFPLTAGQHRTTYFSSSIVREAIKFILKFANSLHAIFMESLSDAWVGFVQRLWVLEIPWNFAWANKRFCKKFHSSNSWIVNIGTITRSPSADFATFFSRNKHIDREASLWISWDL